MDFSLQDARNPWDVHEFSHLAECNSFVDILLVSVVVAHFPRIGAQAPERHGSKPR